jgi:hypothetical protein
MSPSGTIVELMRGCGYEDSVTGLNIVFDDAAGSSLPQNTSLTTGTFKPTQYGPFVPYALPVPPGTPDYTLAAFIGEDPNGIWNLFVQDTVPLDTGQIAGGFTVNITSA